MGSNVLRDSLGLLRRVCFVDSDRNDVSKLDSKASAPMDRHARDVAFSDGLRPVEHCAVPLGSNVPGEDSLDTRCIKRVLRLVSTKRTPENDRLYTCPVISPGEAA